jgi:hypothetical protein
MTVPLWKVPRDQAPEARAIKIYLRFAAMRETLC